MFYSFCEECHSLISSTGIHGKTCSTNIKTTFESSNEPLENSNSGTSDLTPQEPIAAEDVNLPGDQLDKSSDTDDSEREHTRIKISICPICQKKCDGKRELIKHNNEHHPNVITNDDNNDVIDIDQSEEEIDTDESVNLDELYVEEKKPKSRKKKNIRGRGFRYSLDEKKILNAAYDAHEKGLDKMVIIEDVSGKTNLKKKTISVRKYYFYHG